MNIKFTDTQILDWLEKQGLIGINHISYGDYRYYAGEPFGSLRVVANEEMNREQNAKEKQSL